MISIEVTGGKAKQREYVKSMAEFCLKTLMPRLQTIDIEIKLCTPKNAMGYCLELDNNREFEIELDRSQPHRRLLETLAHEMVHVKQYARRELHPATDKWQGKIYNPKKISYWDLPWEVEAHGRETGLFVRWCEHAKISHLKWTQI